jgi:mono/diheme cytochrome c family protein
MRFQLLSILTFACVQCLAAQPRAVMPPEQAAFLKSHCLDCHHADKQKGKVRLDDIPFTIADIPTAERWQKVLNAINSGEMPPEEETQPSEDEKAAFLTHLSDAMVAARKELSDTGGVITMRRLNKREYLRTMQSLLGVTVDAKDLPADGGGGTFDTIGSSLFLSSDQFEQYLAIARKALDAAIVTGSKPEPRTVRIEPEQTTNRGIRAKFRNYHLGGHIRERMFEVAKDRPSTDFGFPDAQEAAFHKLQWERQAGQFADYLTLPDIETGSYLTIAGPNPQEGLTLPENVPPGRYLLRARIAKAGKIWNLHKTSPDNPVDRAQQGRVFIETGYQGQRNDDAMDLLAVHEVTGTIAKPQVLEVAFDLTAHGKRKVALRERQHNDRAAGVNRMFTAQTETGIGVPARIWIDWLEWEGPVIEQWPPAAHAALFFQGPGAEPTDAYAREILARFAARAFRGKEVKPSYLDKLVGHYQERRQAGESFEDALKEPLSIVLASPSFLYLREVGKVAEDHQTAAGKVSPSPRPIVTLSRTELANRLAYFLTSGPPDDELLAADLTEPKVLAAQTQRLLASPEAWHFITGFAHQWLHLERLDFFQFNPRLYPEFDDSAKAAARQEIFHTLLRSLRDDRPLGELLKSDTIVINDLLADLYGIEGVTGPEFRPVKVPAGSPRGGFLGMAAVLAMGSDGERSSPVERGAWVLRKLLHRPPPPAPANVPQLSRHDGKLLPARELLQAHMEEAQCAQCHRRIDPIGFGMENFNAVGQWRETEYTEVFKARRVQQSKEHPIDPSGTLPDGTAFADFFELRDHIARQQEAFATGLIEHLIPYALGRPYGFSDEPLTQEILAVAKTQKFTLRAILTTLVQSETFRRK